MRVQLVFTAVCLIFLGASTAGAQGVQEPSGQSLSLRQCLTVARQRNHSRPASQFALAIAEAQHRQALAGYWPQVTARAGVEWMQHDPSFVFPSSQMYIPPQSITTSAGSALVTIPANAFGAGFPPVDVQMPVSFPGQTITTPVQQFTVPEQHVKLMDKRTESLSGDLKWLLWDGGMRAGYAQQARAGVEAAKAEQRRTDLEVTESVTRLYYAALLARQLHQLGDETLERMEMTLKITESLYQEGSGAVTKADYLDNKVMVESIRALVATLEQNQAAAQAALAYTMGLAWNDTVAPDESVIPYRPSESKLAELVAEAYEFNPDWKLLGAGMKAAEGARKTAVSGYSPKLAFTGTLHRYWNGYGSGLAISPNMQGWTAGAGVEIPLFDGFLTRAKVSEAQARIRQLNEQKLLLKEGVGLQLRQLFLQLQASEKSYAASREAMSAAQQNTDLTTRGYSAGLLATEKIIRAQLQEALVTSAYYKVLYDRQVIQAQIDLVAGRQAPK